MTEPILTVESAEGEVVHMTPAQARIVARELAGSTDLRSRAFRDVLLRWLRGERR